MKTTDSKEKRIRKYLLNGYNLTKLRALDLFGHMNLGDVVFKMRTDGIHVQKIWGKSKSTGSRFAIYFVPGHKHLSKYMK